MCPICGKRLKRQYIMGDGLFSDCIYVDCKCGFHSFLLDNGEVHLKPSHLAEMVLKEKTESWTRFLPGFIRRRIECMSSTGKTQKG